MSADPLEKALAKTLRDRKLVKPGSRGLVCVSGGGDSVAALHLLAALAAEWDLALEVLHFDHGLRAESGREAAWVEARATALGLPFHLRATSHLKEKTVGVLSASRQWRFEETARLARERGAAWAATGHQRDDQTETLLLKLLRGCHLTHLRGMASRSGPFVRPLLDMSRGELRAYLTARKIQWLEDPSNQTRRYRRNRVRNELIPLLEQFTGGELALRLETLEAQSREVAGLLAAYPRPAQNPGFHPPHWIEAAGLLALPPLARGEALHSFVQERLPGQVSAVQMGSALALLDGGKRVWQVNLPGRRTLRRAGEQLFLEHRPAAPPAPEVRQVGSWGVESPPHLQLEGHPGACEKGLPLHNLPAGGTFSLRHRLPGDRFHPSWRERPVKLKDFLRDQHVPLGQRDLFPLLVWENRVIAIFPRFVARGFDRGETEGFCFHVSRN